jgi:shikimate dehydrogenase
MPDLRIYAVTGNPIMHSRSPMMFTAAFRALSIDAVYTRFAARDAADAAEFIRKAGIAGLNITSPFKENIMQYLDRIDEKAGLIGAVNTVVNKNGILFGFNTDWIGVRDAFIENGISLLRKKAVVIGAGGAARAVAHALIAEGSDVVICNRTMDKAEKIALDMGCRVTALTGIAEEMTDVDILVSCLPAVPDHVVPPSLLREGIVILDANYGSETKLLRDAREKGCIIIDGREWLLFQGAAAFSCFTGLEAPCSVMKEQLYTQVGNGKRNLALIGFMASGKTTTAQELGQRLGCATIDIDKEIEQKASCTISELFKKKGERAFRDLERESVARISGLSGAVIACGGGAALDANNRAIIKNNCHVVWLWADPKLIAARAGNNDGRPLLRESDEKSIDEMLKDRLSVYALTSDVIIRTDNGPTTEIAKRIENENHFTFSR